MQMLVVEYARSVLGWDAANSTEFDKGTAHPVVMFMPEGDKERMGGTMRLGARDTVFSENKNYDVSASSRGRCTLRRRARTSRSATATGARARAAWRGRAVLLIHTCCCAQV